MTTTAGVVWVMVGLFLCARAIGWFAQSPHWVIPLSIAALLIGWIKARFIFSKLVKRNIRRIKELSPNKEKICVFAFQAMQSYLIIITMIALGIVLRLSPIPREYLAAIYLAIGSALFFAGFEYFAG